MVASSLLLLDLASPACQWQRDLARALQLSSSSSKRLLLYSESSRALSQSLLTSLGTVFDTTARVAPRLDVLPLLPLAGWDAGALAALPDLATVLAPPAELPSLRDFAQDLNARRPAGLERVALLPLAPPEGAAAAELDAELAGAGGTAGPEPPGEESEAHAGGASDNPQQRTQGEESESSAARAAEELAYDKVAVGGTFDRLHAGHRLLLAATALASTRAVFIGVTGEQLLAKKAHAELLQSYAAREGAAAAYARAVRPGLEVATGALLDPKEPTAAATDPDMGALVVSQETVPGAEAINADRQARGFRELRVIVVATVAASPTLPGGKLSSTALRQQEAEQAAEQEAEATRDEKGGSCSACHSAGRKGLGA